MPTRSRGSVTPSTVPRTSRWRTWPSARPSGRTTTSWDTPCGRETAVRDIARTLAPATVHRRVDALLPAIAALTTTAANIVWTAWTGNGGEAVPGGGASPRIVGKTSTAARAARPSHRPTRPAPPTPLPAAPGRHRTPPTVRLGPPRRRSPAARVLGRRPRASHCDEEACSRCSAAPGRRAGRGHVPRRSLHHKGFVATSAQDEPPRAPTNGVTGQAHLERVRTVKSGSPGTD